MQQRASNVAETEWAGDGSTTAAHAGSTAEQDRAPWQVVAEVLGLAAALWLAAEIGLLVQFENLLSPFWPPNAVLFAAVLLAPRNRLPWYLLAVLPAKAYLAVKTGGSPWVFAVLIGATVLQTVVPAYVLRRLLAAPAVLSSVIGALYFIAFAAILGPLIKSSVAVPAVWWSSGGSLDPWLLGRDWFLSEVIAYLVLVPPIFVVFEHGWRVRWRLRRLLTPHAAEAAAVWTMVLATSVIAFRHSQHASDHIPAALYLPLPFLLWAAVRVGTGGVSVCLLTLTAVAVEHGARHSGPFGDGVAHNVVSVQLYLLMLAIPLLLLAALVRERAVAADALRESEQRFRDLIEYLPVGVAVQGPATEIQLCNKRGAEILGLTPVEFTSRSSLDPVWDVIHDDGTPYPGHAHPVSAAITTRRPVLNALMGVRKAGDVARAWLSVNAVPRLAENGSVREVLCAFHDVTEQKATLQAMRESEQRYRGLVETQTELVCRYLPDTTLTFVNEAYCRFFGQSREQLIGRRFIELIPPSAVDAALQMVARIAQDGQPVTCEHEVIGPGGNVAWQQWIDHPIRDASGNITEFQGIGRDLTEKKQADEALRASLAEIKSLRDRLVAENTYLHEELAAVSDAGELVCRSDAMRTAVQQVRRVAPTLTTVLIHGETGTGKEVLAREVHRLSNRKDRALVRVNCAALPTHLIESELFGHERGAFTGATARRVGRFEVADGATLFLDEIGELPLELQSKLLRVLQEGEFERLGSSKTTKVDVRLIAATNRDLAEAVRTGAFRADLYYRLNVFTVHVPPLRLRREDIVPLATTFLEAAGGRLGRRFDPLTRAAADALLNHEWPGNVRELQNVIERAAVESAGTTIHLPPDWTALVEAARRQPQGHANGNGNGNGGNGHEHDWGKSKGASPMLARLEEIEAKHIRAVLEHTHWRVQGPDGAAAILGLNPSTLRFRMKKLGIARNA